MSLHLSFKSSLSIIGTAEAIPDDPNDEDDMVTKPVHKKDTKTVAKNSGRKVETVVSK